MCDQALENARAADAGAKAGGGAEANRGIGFPRLYDLLLLVLTRGRDRAYREDLLDFAGVAPGHCVLDVGCGTGTQAIAAWRRSQPGGSVVGVDISEKMLAAAPVSTSRFTMRIWPDCRLRTIGSISSRSRP